MEYLIALVVIIVIALIARIVEIIISKQCKHEWEITKKSDIVYNSGPSFGKPYGWWYISKCKHCGKLKEDKFK